MSATQDKRYGNGGPGDTTTAPPNMDSGAHCAVSHGSASWSLSELHEWADKISDQPSGIRSIAARWLVERLNDTDLQYLTNVCLAEERSRRAPNTQAEPRGN